MCPLIGHFTKILLGCLLIWITTSTNVHAYSITIKNVADINQVVDSSPSTNHSNLIEYDGMLYYFANPDGEENTQLWAHDPETKINHLKYEFSTHNKVWHSFVHNERLFFSCDDGVNGKELWVFDQSSSTAKLVFDINDGLEGSNPEGFISYGDNLYFSATSASAGKSLWRYKVSTQAVEFVADVSPGSNMERSKTSGLQGVVFQDKLYFGAYTENEEYQLWVYDELLNTLNIVVDTNAPDFSFYTRTFIIIDNDLFLKVGSNFYVLDSNNDIPQLVDSMPDFSDSALIISDDIFYNNKQYYSYDDGIHGTELWEYDLATDSRRLVSDINDSRTCSYDDFGGYCFNVGSNPSSLTVYNGKLYFDVLVGNPGSDDWGFEDHKLLAYDNVTDTFETIERSDDGREGQHYRDIQVMNGELYFGFRVPAKGYEIWSYDGESIDLVSDHQATGSSSIRDFTIYNDKLYFSANDGFHGMELWTHDDVNNITELTADINGVSGGSWPSWKTVYGDSLYFSAHDGVNGSELWYFNANLNTLQMAAEIDTIYNYGGRPDEITIYENDLYFSGGSNSRHLYRYDINSGTAEIVFELDTVSWSDYDPIYLTVYNNKLFFNAYDGINGRELWVYDKATDIASMAVDIDPRVNVFYDGYSGNPYSLQVYDNKLFFQASDENPEHNVKLWSYDDETEKAEMLMGFDLSYSNRSLSMRGVFNNKLYFYVGRNNQQTPDDDQGLWVFDSVTNDAKKFSNIVDNNELRFDSALTEYNGKLYTYTFSDSSKQKELWVYDLELGSFDRVKNLTTDFPEFISIGSMKVFNGKLYFTADDGVIGNELWSLLDNTAPTIPEIEPVTIVEGETVTLDASATSDVDGNRMTFHWLQASGTQVTLSDETASIITFTAPEVSQAEMLTFTLTVSDGHVETIATIEVNVKHINQAPTIALDAPESVDENNQVTISATVNDADGNRMTFHWLQASGTQVTLSDETASIITFTAPEVSQAEMLTFTLTVSDDHVETIATIEVNVKHINQAPTIALDAPESVDENNQVTISTTVNDADGNELTLTWLQTSGSTTIDVSNANASLWFSAPEVSANETYSFEVTVNDGELSVTESVSVLVKNKAVPAVIPSPEANSTSGGAMAWLLIYLLALWRYRQNLNWQLE